MSLYWKQFYCLKQNCFVLATNWPYMNVLVKNCLTTKPVGVIKLGGTKKGFVEVYSQIK